MWLGARLMMRTCLKAGSMPKSLTMAKAGSIVKSVTIAKAGSMAKVVGMAKAGSRAKGKPSGYQVDLLAGTEKWSSGQVQARSEEGDG